MTLFHSRAIPAPRPRPSRITSHITRSTAVLTSALLLAASSTGEASGPCHTQWRTNIGAGGLLNGTVNVVHTSGNSVFVGGTFSQFQQNGNAVTSPRFARFDEPSQQWTVPHPQGLNGTVRAIESYVGSIIVGGSFTTAGGAANNGITRYDGAGTFHVLGASGTTPFPGAAAVDVHALHVHDGRLFAGGRFQGIGSTVYTVAEWVFDNSNCPTCDWAGQWIPRDMGEDRTVLSMTTHNGMLVVGRNDGGVYAITGSGSFRLGQLLTGPVHALTVFQGELVAGGLFSGSTPLPNPILFNRLARLDAGGTWRPFPSNVYNGTPSSSTGVLTLATFLDRLVVGGNFTRVGEGALELPATHVAIWNGSFWRPVNEEGDEFGSGVSAPVHALRPRQTQTSPPWHDLLIGGSFTQAGMYTQRRIARLRTCMSGPPSADLTGDWVIDISDLFSLLSAWGPCQQSYPNCPADFTGDGLVDLSDLFVMLSSWGPVPLDPNSCIGHCGDQAPGGCWCDDLCVMLGDCCDDACTACEECD